MPLILSSCTQKNLCSFFISSIHTQIHTHTQDWNENNHQCIYFSLSFRFFLSLLEIGSRSLSMQVKSREDHVLKNLNCFSFLFWKKKCFVLKTDLLLEALIRTYINQYEQDLDIEEEKGKVVKWTIHAQRKWTITQRIWNEHQCWSKWRLKCW